MKTVKNKVKYSYREKGSEFTGFLFRSDSKEEFDVRLSEIQTLHSEATHICYAWRINPANPEVYMQDDGEPGGTAGLPILNRLRSHEMINTGAVVVRYYGGTKLGKPGLIRAYSMAIEGCLEKVQIVKVVPVIHFEVTYPYSEQNTIDTLFARYDLQEKDAIYREEVEITLACPDKYETSFLNELRQIKHKLIDFNRSGAGIITEEMS